MEDKQKVMKNESKLKGTRIFIDNERTRGECKIQLVIKTQAD